MGGGGASTSAPTSISRPPTAPKMLRVIRLPRVADPLTRTPAPATPPIRFSPIRASRAPAASAMPTPVSGAAGKPTSANSTPMRLCETSASSISASSSAVAAPRTELPSPRSPPMRRSAAWRASMPVSAAPDEATALRCRLTREVSAPSITIPRSPASTWLAVTRTNEAPAMMEMPRSRLGAARASAGAAEFGAGVRPTQLPCSRISRAPCSTAIPTRLALMMLGCAAPTETPETPWPRKTPTSLPAGAPCCVRPMRLPSTEPPARVSRYSTPATRLAQMMLPRMSACAPSTTSTPSSLAKACPAALSPMMFSTTCAARTPPPPTTTP